jgi:hypothetical protein
VAKEVDSVECRCRFLTQVAVVGLLSDSQEWEVKVSAAEDSAVTTEVKVAEWVALVVSAAVIPAGTVVGTTVGIERTAVGDNGSASG